jgi:hypothetical protein
VEGRRQLDSPVGLSSGKVHPYSSNGRLDGLQSQFGHFGEEKNLLALPGMEPWIIQPILPALNYMVAI